MIKSLSVAATAGLCACGDINVAALWPGEALVHIEPELARLDSWGSTLHAGGVLAIHAGTVDTSIDTITISYSQPSGAVLTHRVVMR